MRKFAQRKNSFPQDAEACPEKKRLSAKCGSLPRGKTAFRKMRKLAQKKNGFPQNAEACPEEKRLSAKCGSLPRGKTAFRKMRKSAQRKNSLTQNAESHFKFQFSAKCGNLKAGFAIGLVLRNKLNRQTLQVLLTQNLKDDAQRLLVLGVCTKAKGAAMYTSCLFLLTQKQTLFADCALM